MECIGYLQLWSSFGREFTMEYNNIAHWSLWNNFWCFSLNMYKLGNDLVMCEQVDGVADVATLKFIRIPAVDDFERCHRIFVIAVQQFGHCLHRNRFEITVAAIHKWQAEWFAEIANEIWLGGCYN